MFSNIFSSAIFWTVTKLFFNESKMDTKKACTVLLHTVLYKCFHFIACKITRGNSATLSGKFCCTMFLQASLEKTFNRTSKYRASPTKKNEDALKVMSASYEAKSVKRAFWLLYDRHIELICPIQSKKIFLFQGKIYKHV